MGVYESLMRSEESINQLAGVVQGYFAKKRQDEERRAMRERFTERVPRTKEVPMELTEVPPTTITPGRTIGEEGFAGPVGPKPGQVETPVPTDERMRPIQSFEDIYALGDILKLPPEKMAEMTAKFEETRRPKIHFGAPGQVPYRVDETTGRAEPAGPAIPFKTQISNRLQAHITAAGGDVKQGLQAYEKALQEEAAKKETAATARIKTGVQLRAAAPMTAYQKSHENEFARHNKAIEENKRITGDIFEFDEDGNVSGINPVSTPAQLSAARRNVNTSLINDRKTLRVLRNKRENYGEDDPESLKAIDEDIATLLDNIAIYQQQFTALNTRKLQPKKTGLPKATGKRFEIISVE